MRLIDADKLIDKIKYEGLFGSGYSDSEREDNIVNMINKQPTEHNIEKVVEQLIEYSIKYYDCMDDSGEGMDMIDLDVAFDIIAKGGINHNSNNSNNYKGFSYDFRDDSVIKVIDVGASW